MNPPLVDDESDESIDESDNSDDMPLTTWISMIPQISMMTWMILLLLNKKIILHTCIN